MKKFSLVVTAILLKESLTLQFFQQSYFYFAVTEGHVENVFPEFCSQEIEQLS